MSLQEKMTGTPYAALLRK